MDTSVLTPHQKLDLLLDYINRIEKAHFRTFAEIIRELKEKEIEFGAYSKELSMMLDKLEEDGYVRTELHDAPNVTSFPRGENDKIKAYYPSFNGALFVADGGYVQQVIKIANENKRLTDIERTQKDNEKRMRNLNRLLVVGSFALVLWEMWKAYKTIPHIFCWGH